MSASLGEIAELVQRETGIKLQPGQYPSLRTAIARAVPRADAVTFLRVVRDPVTGADALGRLIDEVTVNETSFFRERRALEAISWRLLLERAHARGQHEIRVWSAACSTGEEAYTLAILALEAFAPLAPPVRILATDISTHVLGRAWEGRYGERAVRTVEPAIRSRYFIQHDDRHVEIGPLPRRLVEFTRHNLSRDPIPPLGERQFDLILCRNVLIYFDHETVDHVITSLEQSIWPDGMLILGSADTLCGTTRRLARFASMPSVTLPRVTPTRTLRRPLRVTPRAASTLQQALQAAGEGRRDDALAATGALLAANALDSDASFVRGLVLLESGEAGEAAESLRRALYADPTFGLAAFQLGRAYDELGDSAAARRAYGQALRTLEAQDERHEALLDQVDLGDIASACSERLAALS